MFYITLTPVFVSEPTECTLIFNLFKGETLSPAP